MASNVMKLMRALLCTPALRALQPALARRSSQCYLHGMNLLHVRPCTPALCALHCSSCMPCHDLLHSPFKSMPFRWHQLVACPTVYYFCSTRPLRCSSCMPCHDLLHSPFKSMPFKWHEVDACPGLLLHALGFCCIPWAQLHRQHASSLLGA
eukprot:1145043-Pelagomonas_calceolata.AAC.5